MKRGLQPPKKQVHIYDSKDPGHSGEESVETDISKRNAHHLARLSCFYSGGDLIPLPLRETKKRQGGFTPSERPLPPKPWHYVNGDGEYELHPAMVNNICNTRTSIMICE